MTESETKAILDLLAVIHCDGGHHVAQYGVEKAVIDAREKWYGRAEHYSFETFAHEERIKQAEMVIGRQRDLLRRSMAIIAEAIMHGMPITEEVTAVRNEIVVR